MPSRSRYIKSGRKPLPKKPRSKVLEGSFEDSNRFIRCWHCNTILDTTRISFGDSNGNSYTDPIRYADPTSEDPLERMIAIDRIDMVGVMMALGADGSVIPIYTPHLSSAVRGCWLCGTTNLP